MKKALVVLSILMTFVAAITIPDFLPRKASHATLCRADRGPEHVQQIVSDYELALRIAIWFMLAQMLVVLALAFVTRTPRRLAADADEREGTPG